MSQFKKHPLSYLKLLVNHIEFKESGENHDFKVFINSSVKILVIHYRRPPHANPFASKIVQQDYISLVVRVRQLHVHSKSLHCVIFETNGIQTQIFLTEECDRIWGRRHQIIITIVRQTIRKTEHLPLHKFPIHSLCSMFQSFQTSTPKLIFFQSDLGFYIHLEHARIPNKNHN